MYWFTSDEHLGHASIIKYCSRPFSSVEEMDKAIIARHNENVSKQDIVVHAGDFCWARTYEEAQEKYIRHLNGDHIFIKGSHDRWLPKSAKCRWRKMLDDRFVVVDHYAGRTWERSYHGSWQLYGHWHSKQDNVGLQLNVAVDLHNFYPWSFDEIEEIMAGKIRASEVKSEDTI